MNDDELFARLRAADTARAEGASTRGSSWIDDLTEATMTETRTFADTPPKSPPRRPHRWLPAAAAAAVLAAAGIALAVGGGEDPAPPAAQPSPALTLTMAADDPMASCLQVSVESLQPMELAFSGTATAVEETSVTITPERWYKGGQGATSVRLTTMGPEMVPLLGNVQFEQGKRYLITASDGQVTACGYSAEWNEEMAALYEQAFD